MIALRTLVLPLLLAAPIAADSLDRRVEGAVVAADVDELLAIRNEMEARESADSADLYTQAYVNWRLTFLVPPARERGRHPWIWVALTLCLGSIAPLLYFATDSGAASEAAGSR